MCQNLQQDCRCSELGSAHRMGKVKDMRENEHGQYTELTDEKEVIRVSA